MISLNDEQGLIQKIVFRLVKKHIAGSTLDSALKQIRESNAKGIHATVTFLNEKVDDISKARYNANTYVQFIKQSSRLHLNADVSLRLSQMGYHLNGGYLEKCLEDVFGVNGKELSGYLTL